MQIDSSTVALSSPSSMAPVGQKRVHVPQRVHLSVTSISFMRSILWGIFRYSRSYLTSSSMLAVLSTTFMHLMGQVWAHISHLTQLSSILAALWASESAIASTGHSSTQRLHLTHLGVLSMNLSRTLHLSISMSAASDLSSRSSDFSAISLWRSSSFFLKI